MRDKPRRRYATAPASPGERLIRKYGNRRLYDTRASRYVTLEDLVEVFAGSEAVRVLDAVSGEDLTKRVLAQVILSEEARHHVELVPLELLRALLRQREGHDAFQRRLLRWLEVPVVPSVPSATSDPTRGSEMADLKRRLRVIESRIKRQDR